MTLERSVTVLYYAKTDEPVVKGQLDLGNVEGTIAIHPQPGSDTGIVVSHGVVSNAHQEKVDYSRIPDSDDFQSRISARFTLPQDADTDDFSDRGDTYTMFMDAVYSLINEAIQNENSKNRNST